VVLHCRPADDAVSTLLSQGSCLPSRSDQEEPDDYRQLERPAATCLSPNTNSLERQCAHPRMNVPSLSGSGLIVFGSEPSHYLDGSPWPNQAFLKRRTALRPSGVIETVVTRRSAVEVDLATSPDFSKVVQARVS